MNIKDKVILFTAIVSICFLVITSNAYCSVILSAIDREELEELGDELVYVALHHTPNTGRKLMGDLEIGGYAFYFIDTILANIEGSKVLALAQRKEILDVEIVDDGLAIVIRDLLLELFRVSLYDHIQAFDISILNISLGPPKHLLRQNRAAERTVRRAYSKIIGRHGIPIVTSAGNDGPIMGSINPWGLANGVVVVGATDFEGKELWERSSRMTANEETAGKSFFVAHGKDTIGAFDSRFSKSKEMREAEKRVGLAEIVGPENVDKYSVRSGTSFAAGNVSRLLCYPHQMMTLLRGYLSAMEDIDPFQMTPFVRGYIDSEIDESHPLFKNRLADKRHHFGGLKISIDRARKQQMFDFFANKAIDVDLKFTPDLVTEFLKAIAKPVPNSSFHLTGYGFISIIGAKQFLENAKLSNLIQITVADDDPRKKDWIKMAKEYGDSKLLSNHEAALISEYCQNYDLVLALPLEN